MDGSGGIVRDGELTKQSLVDAVHAERQQGRRPRQLAVASAELEERALAILSPAATIGLADLVSVVANVVIDPELPAGSWELRAQ